MSETAVTDQTVVAYIDPETQTPVYVGQEIWKVDGSNGVVQSACSDGGAHVRWEANRYTDCVSHENLLLVNPKGDLRSGRARYNWYREGVAVPVIIEKVYQDAATEWCVDGQEIYGSCPAFTGASLRAFRQVGTAFKAGQKVALAGLGGYYDTASDVESNLARWGNPTTGTINQVDYDDPSGTYFVILSETGTRGMWTHEKWLALPSEESETTEVPEVEETDVDDLLADLAPEPTIEEQPAVDPYRRAQEGDLFSDEAGRVLFMSTLKILAEGETARVMLRFDGPQDKWRQQTPTRRLTGYVDTGYGWTFLETVANPTQDTVDALSRTMATANAALSAQDEIRRVRAERDAIQQKWDGLSERAMELADEKGYCREYDEMAEELGLQRRTHDYTVDLEVTVSFTISVSDAASEDQAREQAEQEARNALNGHFVSALGQSLSVDEITITDSNPDD